MMVEAKAPTVEKQQFQNTTGGWVGVVKLNHKGEEHGASVEPNGTVWLSEPEQILTANAPRRAEDNPFTPSSFKRVNPETSEIETYTVTPLVPISENRYVPAGDRPIPGVGGVATETGEADVAEKAEREGVQPAQPPQTPQRTEEPAQPAAAPEPGAEVAQAAPSDVEETGAAQPPSGPAETGEFAAHEEVGTPFAPSQPPAPWSPGSESAEGAQAAGRTGPPDPSGE